MNATWFDGVDFDLVERREVPAPWIPDFRSAADTSCFEKYPDSAEEPNIQINDDPFADF